MGVVLQFKPRKPKPQTYTVFDMWHDWFGFWWA